MSRNIFLACDDPGCEVKFGEVAAHTHGVRYRTTDLLTDRAAEAGWSWQWDPNTHEWTHFCPAHRRPNRYRPVEKDPAHA